MDTVESDGSFEKKDGGLPDPGQIRRRVCGFGLGQGLSSSRARWFPWSPLFLSPHIAWYMKSNPVRCSEFCRQATVSVAVNPTGDRSGARRRSL